MITQKSYAAEFKAGIGDQPGTFSALVSVFGNVDLQGDRVMPGAFTDSIKAWSASGDPIPVVFSHDWGDPFSHIGYVWPKDLAETSQGLQVKEGHLDINDNPTAAQVYRLMQRRSLKEWSFSYDISGERQGSDGANELTKLGIIELGPTLKGANPETQLLAVKAAGAVQAAVDATPLASLAIEDVDALIAAVEERAKAVDTAGWDGPAAMSKIAQSDRSDSEKAAAYRAICAGRKDGDPSLQSSWALPHHREPGLGPNEAGTRNAIGRLPQTQGLVNEGAAKSHLQNHMKEINPDYEPASASVDDAEAKSGRVIGAKAAARLKEDMSAAVNEAVDSFVAAVNSSGDGTASAPSEPAKDDEPTEAKSDEQVLREWIAEQQKGTDAP